MAEYIERERIKNAIVGACLMNQNCPMFIAAKIDQMIDCQPAADVARVVHGRWECGCQCSVCGDRHGPYNSRHRPYYNFCPNCGAKMDIDEEV